MACAIEITHVSGVGIGPASILVRGRAVDCAPDFDSGNGVIVGISCGSEAGPFTEFPAKVEADGTWEAVIPAGATCKCGEAVVVRTRCATDPNCTAQASTNQLPCRQCPVVDVNEPELTPVVTCNPNGTASVKLFARVHNNGASTVVATLVCGPGGTPQSGGVINVTPGQTALLTGTCLYPTPFAPQPFIRFFDPVTGEQLACPDVALPVFPLAPCPRNCPQVENLEVNVTGCTGSGRTATASFSASVSPPTSGCFFLWEFGDGSDNVITTTASTQHTYTNPGSYAAALTAVCGRCADTATKLVRVRSCDSESGETIGCKLLRIAAVIAAILATIATFVLVCVPVSPAVETALAVAAAIFGATSLALFSLWSVFCKKPCGAALLISWQILLGTGIGALYLSDCCPHLKWIGAILFAVASATAIAWQRRCNIGFCRFNEELAVVISVIVLPAMSWIAGIGAINACLSDWVHALVGAISAEIAIALLSCREVAPASR